MVPPCPSSAPHTIFDPKETAKLVLQLANWTAAGPSGWTAELLLPLLEDESCLDAITLLAQLIANNELDDHSRRLLTSSVLHAIPKSDGGLRPLAMGELFVKLACKYCFLIASHSFPTMFEPIQVAVGCPGGPQRALLH